LGQWVQRYLKDGAAHKRATTMARDKAVLNHWFVPALAKRAIGSITPHDVRTIIESMTAARLAPRTVRTNYGVLRGSLGLREAEVFGLKVKAIDFLRKTVTVEETVNEVNGQLIVGDAKTRSSVRTISLPDFIVSVLADHLQRTGRVEPDDYVVQAPDGGPVRANR
jgi:integrase